jgi:hypothetical protein
MPPVEVISEVVVCALVVGPRGLVWSITLIDPGAARPDAADATDLQKSALGWRSSVRGVVGSTATDHAVRERLARIVAEEGRTLLVARKPGVGALGLKTRQPRVRVGQTVA